jgi:hypothetical protein
VKRGGDTQKIMVHLDRSVLKDSAEIPNLPKQYDK